MPDSLHVRGWWLQQLLQLQDTSSSARACGSLWPVPLQGSQQELHCTGADHGESGQTWDALQASLSLSAVSYYLRIIISS